MPITYPRAMIAPLAAASFEPDYQTALAPESGGEMKAVSLGPARWRAEYASPPLKGATAEAFRAWLASMEGGLGTFYATDPLRAKPAAYPGGFAGLTRHGGGAFDGAAASWSIDSARAVLTVNGLPSTYQVSAGDLVSFAWDTSKRFLTRALESVTAAAGVAMFEVRPRVDAFVSASAVLTFDNPSCVMRVEPGSVEVREQPGGVIRASFRAVQILEA